METPQSYQEPTSETNQETTPVHDQKPVHPKASQDFWRFGAELIRTAIIVSVLAYGIRAFLIQPFVVEGSSMAPRFQTNDFLIVDKLSYRLHTPSRGDIIVFKYPYDLQTNYVKRIIGLPGETVKIEDGKVEVINKNNPNGFILTEPYLSVGNTTQILPTSTQNEYTVPEGKYFVLGDNRHASSDSREWGFLPKEDVIGRVFVQAFPFNRASWVSHARYDESLIAPTPTPTASLAP